MRRLLVKTHRYLGIALGIFYVFLGLTGSILTFYPEIDSFLNPQLNIRSSDKIQNIDLVLGNSQAVYPEKFLHSIFLTSDERRFYQVWFTPSSKDTSLMWEVMVHPDSAKVLGHRQAVPVYEFNKENLVNTIYTLHLLMFVGQSSYIFLGACGIFFLITLVIGVCLWWPTTKNVLISFSIKRGASSYRRAFDLHRVFGIYGLVFLFVISISGIYLSLPTQVEHILGVNDEFQKPTGLVNTYKPGNLNLDGVLRHTSSLVSDKLKLKSVWMPSELSNFWRVTYIDSENIGSTGSEVILMIDAKTGLVVSMDRYEKKNNIKQILSWQLPLHSGKAFGVWGRIAVFVTGLLPLILFITGLIIWNRKRAY